MPPPCVPPTQHWPHHTRFHRTFPTPCEVSSLPPTPSMRKLSPRKATKLFSAHGRARIQTQVPLTPKPKPFPKGPVRKGRPFGARSDPKHLHFEPLALIICKVRRKYVPALRGSLWVENTGLCDDGEAATGNIIIFLLFSERPGSAKPRCAGEDADSYQPRQFPALSKINRVIGLGLCQLCAASRPTWLTRVKTWSVPGSGGQGGTPEGTAQPGP